MEDRGFKYIIYNQTDIPDTAALRYVISVMMEGMISETKQGKQYCFVTTFEHIVVECTRRNKTFTFVVREKS